MFNFREYIKKFEETIFKGYKLPIFKGYTAKKETGAKKIIEEIYSTLDKDIEKAKKQLE
ncbi:hypothetical protein J6G99_00670 [bacterium]|nr:hypothetical protein [bacterium]